MTIKTLLVNITLITTIGLFAQTPLLAKVYKWVDENGQINYGDQPGNATAERIADSKLSSKPAVKSSAEEKNVEAKKSTEIKDENKESPEKPVEEPVKVEQPKLSKKEKRRLCKEGREDYKKISSRGRLREISKKGEYVYLTEKQRQQRLTTAKKKQRKYCR